MTDLPQELKYTKSHEWVRVSGDNAVIGITDFAQEELHEVVFVEIPDPGKAVNRGKEFAAVESVKARSEIFSPVTGTVEKSNSALVEGKEPAKPELINEDPYGKGWIAEVKMSNPEELKDMLSSEDYRKFIESKK